MSMRNPKLIRDLTTVSVADLTPTTLVELETVNGSFKGTIADLFTAMGDQWIDGDTLRLLINSKMPVGGAADDTTRFNGKTEAEWLALIKNTEVNSALTVGGYTLENLASKAEVNQLRQDLEHLAGIMQDLFDSLT